MADAFNRIVLIGGSAGGQNAAVNLLAQLDEDLQAPVFVILHLGAGPGESIIRKLSNAGPLEADFAGHGEVIEPKRIYVAPPDHHLFVKDGRNYLTRGPLVNRSRPAIDLAFRSAAVSYRDKVVGVVLSGMLDDGAAGLNAISQCGGVSMVQDPEEAQYSSMPRAALYCGDPDYVLPVSEIGQKINELAKKAKILTSPVPDVIEMENRLDMDSMDDIAEMDQIGEQVPFVCPECDGPLWKVKNGNVPHYRCHIGHSQSLFSLLQSQDEEIERTLWTAYRTLEEKARLQENLAEKEKDLWGNSFRSRAARTREDAERIRKLLMEIGKPHTHYQI